MGHFTHRMRLEAGCIASLAPPTSTDIQLTSLDAALVDKPQERAFVPHSHAKNLPVIADISSLTYFPQSLDIFPLIITFQFSQSLILVSLGILFPSWIKFLHFLRQTAMPSTIVPDFLSQVCGIN